MQLFGEGRRKIMVRQHDVEIAGDALAELGVGIFCAGGRGALEFEAGLLEIRF